MAARHHTTKTDKVTCALLNKNVSRDFKLGRNVNGEESSISPVFWGLIYFYIFFWIEMSTTFMSTNILKVPTRSDFIDNSRFAIHSWNVQGIALTGRNTTGPPSRVAPGELRCRWNVTDDRRRR